MTPPMAITRARRFGTTWPSVGEPAATVPDSGGGVYSIGESLGERPGDGVNLLHSFETFDIGSDANFSNRDSGDATC